LAAALRTDPLGEFQRSPRPFSRNRAGVLLLRRKEEREKWEGRKGRGLPPLYLTAGYGPVSVIGTVTLCKKGSPYSITERRVPELIPVLGSQPAGDVSHKPGGRLPLLSVRPTVTPTTLKSAATNFAAW